MIEVILADNTRPACGGPPLIRYSAGGVFLALTQKGLDVRWVDQMSDIPPAEGAFPTEQTLADVQCYAVFFGNKAKALHQMQEARRARLAPRLIIAFGPFASVFPEEILSRGLADIVIVNDPEFVIPMVLTQDSSLSHLAAIPNLAYKDGDKIVHTPKQSFHDLDQLPFIGPYLYKPGQLTALTMTARGCQYHCVYCDRNVLWGGGVRNRSVENVVAEIKELVEIKGAQRIRFLDEDLAADYKRIAGICQGIRRIQGKFHWECAVCVDSVNRDMLLMMARSGCSEIYFGVESASPQVLRRIGKTYGRQEILSAVRWAKEACLQVEVMLTTGNPGETDEDRRQTLSVLQEIGPGVTVNTNRLVILPGTAFFRQGLKEGRYTRESFFEDQGLVFYDEISGHTRNV